MDPILMLSIFKEMLEYKNAIVRRKMLLQRERSELEKKIERNKRLAIYLLYKKKRHRMRSCWIRPELLNAEQRYWETTVPFYSGIIMFD